MVQCLHKFFNYLLVSSTSILVSHFCSYLFVSLLCALQQFNCIIALSYTLVALTLHALCRALSVRTYALALLHFIYVCPWSTVVALYYGCLRLTFIALLLTPSYSMGFSFQCWDLFTSMSILCATHSFCCARAISPMVPFVVLLLLLRFSVPCFLLLRFPVVLILKSRDLGCSCITYILKTWDALASYIYLRLGMLLHHIYKLGIQVHYEIHLLLTIYYFYPVNWFWSFLEVHVICFVVLNRRQ
jgi:hypothetical protein